MGIIHEQQVVIQQLTSEWYAGYVQEVSMLRLDLLHPVISGNKWYKLKHNLQYALQNGYKTILTFGGAYSNHLVATAAVAKEYGIKSIGMVRGLHAQNALTTTLLECKELGMQLIFISREEYNNKEDHNWLLQLEAQFDNLLIIPEGGANEWGRQGAGEIASLIPENYTNICVSVGTGTTLIGLRNELPTTQKLLGFVPMKQGAYLKNEISRYIAPDQNHNWQLYDQWHFGGFGKQNKMLLAFMNEFYHINKIPLDVVYTGKMMYGVQQLLREQYFPTDAKVLCVHTGGLQGNASVQQLLDY